MPTVKFDIGYPHTYISPIKVPFYTNQTMCSFVCRVEMTSLEMSSLDVTKATKKSHLLVSTSKARCCPEPS